MSANADWKNELSSVLKKHNTRHGTRDKNVSYRTMEARRQGLFRCFLLLRKLGFQIGPSGLKQAHISALVRYWTADPAMAKKLKARNSALQERQLPYSAAYIQSQLSMLRVLATWIGKPGLVRPAEDYVTDKALVARTEMGQTDKSWSSAGIDCAKVLAEIEKIDTYVAVQLEVMWAFGLRRKEAVMFKPHLAEVPKHALPPTAIDDERYIAVLRITRGTKGGRLRYTPVRHAWQHEALKRARDVARHKDDHIGTPAFTLKQSLDRFSNVLRSAGITRKKLGVTPHGLRHQFATDLYFELTGLNPPVRSGPYTDASVMERAYLEVAEQLGHGRPQIAGAYLGSRRRKRASN